MTAAERRSPAAGAARDGSGAPAGGPGRARRLLALLVLGVLTVGVGSLLELTGLASGYLFAALLVGLAAALVLPRSGAAVPDPAFHGAQATLGVVLGTYLDSSSLSALADDWLPVAAVSLATLGISVGVGLALSRTTSVDEPTGTLGMVAGGASGIVAMADELGADSRLVAFMQYLRVLIVVLTAPLIVAVAFPGRHADVVLDDGPLLGDLRWWALTAVVALVGARVGRLSKLPAATLLGPLILAGALALTVAEDFAVPPLLRETAFALIGLQVGLRFTPGTVRTVGALLLPVVGAILALMAASFAMGLGLMATTSATLLDAYLATTPGGLYAVLAVAFGTGADTTLVLAVQTLRLITLVILAPFVVRWIVRRLT